MDFMDGKFSQDVIKIVIDPDIDHMVTCPYLIGWHGGVIEGACPYMCEL